ncbi:GxxExxY protein [Methylophilus sp. VKM B-3414]|uniref:GxxExxY protein n=1 Tax=Methylophilus sp. VKM B-3414 TaxID=3076121 RepID=UPI0028C6FB80|nr:GxxExxY protein [Methylophilus sp. VKM B-3414]MDT7848023.1 GxxExxY protein [Methylophilus sp. VKM B-3414]
MDLVDTLRKKIDVLDDGEYVPGLKAVLLHIETAFRHLSRGQEADEETAFTDAIYRTNQAFEGSIKEAYRVLAGQDPAKKRPYDIESYLEQNNIFRSRVLSQLTTYRTEWRNPSAHDYKLDFDESEAFLAIVSVSAFACLLLDQIAERLAFARSQAEADAQKDALAQNLAPTANSTLLVYLAQLLSQFCAIHMQPPTSSSKQTESQVIGALHGFLASAAPDLEVKTEARLDPEKSFRADLLVSRNGEVVVVELKRRLVKQMVVAAMAQVQTYMLIGGVKDAVLLFLPERPSEVEQVAVSVGGDGKLVVLAPQGSNLALHTDVHASHGRR